MWKGEKQIDAIESHTVNLGRSGEVEHRIEIDGRFRIGSFSYQTRPHSIVKRGMLHSCGSHFRLLCPGDFERQPVFLRLHLGRVNPGDLLQILD